MRQFIKLKGNYYALSSIVSLRSTRDTKGKDGVVRNWVATVTPEAIGGSTVPGHASIWLSHEEAAELIAELDSEERS